MNISVGIGTYLITNLPSTNTVMSLKRRRSDLEVDDGEGSDNSPYTDSEESIGKRRRSDLFDMTSEQESSDNSSYNDNEESDHDEQPEDEEKPMFKTILDKLSKAISRKDASELLHSFAVSKGILFWTNKGQILHHQRRIHMTTIAKLNKYILLPYNPDVAKPRALNTFLDGIAEIGINKRLVRNKKILADLVIREHAELRQTTSGSDDEYESDTSSQYNNDNEVSEAERGEGSECEDENDGDSDKHSVSDREETEVDLTSCQKCSSANLCHIFVVKCPKCKWQDGYISTQAKLDCEICQDRFSLEKKTLRELLQLCNTCGFLSHTNARSGHKQYFEADTCSYVETDSEID